LKSIIKTCIIRVMFQLIIHTIILQKVFSKEIKKFLRVKDQIETC